MAQLFNIEYVGAAQGVTIRGIFLAIRVAEGYLHGQLFSLRWGHWRFSRRSRLGLLSRPTFLNGGGGALGIVLANSLKVKRTASIPCILEV